MSHSVSIRPRRMNGTVKLLFFFSSAFIITWLLWLPSVLKSMGVTFPEPLLIFSQLAILGPMIAAMIMTGCSGGRKELGKLFKNAWNWRFPKIWLLAILVLPIVMTGLALIIRSGLAGGPMQWDVDPATLPVFALMLLFTGGPVEEFGWRGYAMPLLLKKFSPVIASLILGLLHGLWHLPLHFMEGTVQSAIPFWEFVLMTAVSAIVYTWIYIGTKGSLTAMILHHWFSNLASARLVYWDTDSGRWIFFILECVLAILIILLNRKRMLAAPSRQAGDEVHDRAVG